MTKEQKSLFRTCKTDLAIWEILAELGRSCPICGGGRGWEESFVSETGPDSVWEHCEYCHATGWVSKRSAENYFEAMMCSPQAWG